MFDIFISRIDLCRIHMFDFSVVESRSLFSVNAVSAIVFWIDKKIHKPCTYCQSNQITFSKGTIFAILYYAMIFSVYALIGLSIGGIPIWILMILLIGSAILFACSFYCRSWMIILTNDSWSLKQFGCVRHFILSEISSVYHIPLLGYLIYVNQRPVCFFHLNLKNASIFWLKIRSKVI